MNRLREPIPGALVFTLGVGTLALHLTHLLGSDETPVSLLLGAVLPALISGVLIAAAVWLNRSSFSPAHVERIGVMCWIGAFLFACVGGLTVIYQRSEGVLMTDVAVVILNNATAGGVVGLVVGVYESRTQLTQKRLLAERTKVGRLNQRLTVLNRILRHDIRNDVNIIQGHANLILEGDDSEVRANVIAAKASEMYRLSENARLIERLLTRGDDAHEPVDVTNCVRTHLDRVGRDYVVTVHADLPAEACACGSTLLGSAVDNLFENAVEHNDAPNPTLDVSVTIGQGAIGEYVEVRIADNGPGIPAEEVEVLETGTETPLEHGSGMGLWLANWIVRESGGDLSFAPNQPHGTVVTIRLQWADCSP